jgi:hypothetical protein
MPSFVTRFPFKCITAAAHTIARMRGTDPERMSAEREEAKLRTESRLDVSTGRSRYIWEDGERMDFKGVALVRDRSVKSAVRDGSGSTARAWAIARPRRPFEPRKMAGLAWDLQCEGGGLARGDNETF